MAVTLKPIDQQTIVITGASSGIGLVTARQAAERGARLVLVGRSGDALNELAEQITAKGGQAVPVVADVADQAAIGNVTRVARDTFGGFDTWVNNAGVTIYGNIESVSVEDMRQVFETNYWGVVRGSLEAVAHLRERGGALINIGSVLSDRAIALQGTYCATKHAVKGFTDALRMELERDGAPISVTLIKPSAINTPYTRNARNYMSVGATVPPPVYAPDLVAQAILHAAEHPRRDLFVGGGGKALSIVGVLAPRLTDYVMKWIFIDKQQRDEPPQSTSEDALYQPSERLAERGDYEGPVIETSPYSSLTQSPARVALALGVAGALGVGWRWARRQ